MAGRINSFRWAVALALVFGVTSRALSGEPRARTLRLDPDRKEWVEVSRPQPGTPAGALHAIRLQLDAEKYRKALSAVKRFEKQYGEDSALYPAIMLARAEALIGQAGYYKAHAVLQEFLNRYSGIELTAEALRLEFVIAETYLTGVKRKVVGLRLLSGVDIAYSILDEISVDYPEDAIAPLAIKTKADHLFAQGDYTLAEMEYERLLRDHPASRYHRYALRRSAESAMAGFAGVVYDEAPLIEAGERFEEYRQRYPTAADQEGVSLVLEGIREKRAAKELSIGRYYERTKRFGSAVFYYRLTREHWPGTAAAVRAAARLEVLAGPEQEAPEPRP